jgi:hypothetical protein
MGTRSGKKGAGIGLVLAVIAPPTRLAGVVGGGTLGHFHHKGDLITKCRAIARQVAEKVQTLLSQVETPLEAGARPPIVS